MADTGYNWSAWGFVQIGAGNWDDDDVADNATDTGDATSLDDKAACEVSLHLVEDNTGVIDGVMTVFILGDTDGTNYEETTLSGARSFTITPVQNDTVYKRFSVDPTMFGSFKLALFNESGQTIAVDARYRTATIPAAS